MPAAAHSRQVRALALASASFGLGLAGHLQAGGHSGSPGAMAFGAAFCALSAWSYAWRPLSGPAVAGILLGNQLVMHVALAHGTPSTGSAAHAAAAWACHDAPLATDRAATALIPGGWMLLAHLVATLLTAAVIVSIEAAWLGLTALAGWIARVARICFDTPLLPPRPRTPISIRTPAWTSRAIGARPGRGPPLLRTAW